MQRRTFLGLSAASLTAIAGCSSTDETPEAETTQPPSTTTQTPTNTSQTTAQTTTKEADTETTDVPEQTERPESTETATPESTPTPRDLALEDVKRADASIADSLDAYASFAGAANVSWTDVTAATTDFKTQPVREEISTAEDHLDAATEHDSSLDDIDHLTDVCDFIRACTEAQDALIDAYETTIYIQERIANERYQHARTGAGDLEDQAFGVRTPMRKVRDSASYSDVEASSALSRGDFDEKRTQFEDEHEAFEALPDLIIALIMGIEAYHRAVEEYENEDYSEAESEGNETEDDLLDVRDGFEALSTPESLRSAVGTFTDWADEYAEKAAELAEDAGEQAHS